MPKNIMKTLLVMFVLLLSSPCFARPSYQQIYNQNMKAQRQAYSKYQQLMRTPGAMRQYLQDQEYERRVSNARSVGQHIHVVVDRN